MTEKELFPPVRDLFVKRGYKVNAEVRDCDVTATKDDEFIIIELKKNLSVTLLAQGLKRLKTGADVYIAVPKPKKYSLKKFRNTFAVIKSYLSRPNSNRQHATIEKGVKFSQKSTAERLTQTQAV